MAEGDEELQVVYRSGKKSLSLEPVEGGVEILLQNLGSGVGVSIVLSSEAALRCSWALGSAAMHSSGLEDLVREFGKGNRG